MRIIKTPVRSPRANVFAELSGKVNQACRRTADVATGTTLAAILTQH
jgi:hypothetical protein